VTDEEAVDETEAVGAVSDEVKLLPNGQIRLMVNGDLFLLRGPNMGQLRSYRVELIDLSKRVAERATARAEQAKSIATGDTDALTVLASELGDDAEDEQLTEDTLALLRRMVADLAVAGNRLPSSDDEMPSWAPNLGMLVQFVHHWRRVPQAPGR
jgi:hypothetical protein